MARASRRGSREVTSTKEEHNVVKNGVTPQERKVHIFVSYARADNQIATLLREEIIDINRDRIECFLDTETIESGEGWEFRLQEALNNADWLVCIYTGDQSEFCGYEIGVFTQGKVLAKTERTSRLVCLHDVVNLPVVFRAHQNRFIELPPEANLPEDTFDETSFYKKSGLFKFFEDFCKYEGLYTTRSDSEAQRKSQALVRKVKLITEAFRAGRGNDKRFDIPTQLGIEVTVSLRNNERLQVIPPNALVKGTFESFKLFDLMPPREGEQMPTTSWGELKAACRSGDTDHPWVERLERDMRYAASGRTLGESESVFRSKNKIYRAILHRHIVYWNGTHLFGVIFVETLLRQFIGNERASLVLTGLLIATRFRTLYLENLNKTAEKFDDTISDVEFQGNYWQFLDDLERMREEGKDQAFDAKVFIQSFGETRKGIAESFVQAGKTAREALDFTLPPRAAKINAESRPKLKELIMQFLRNVESLNAQFLRVAANVYREELEAQLQKSAL